MSTVVVYWSGTGNTQALAEAVSGGVRAAGGSCDIFAADKISAAKAAAYDKLLLGCPAMGAEELEGDIFEPFYGALEKLIKGKTVGLFGSYGWGGGEWMEIWQKRAEASGIKVAAVLAVNESESSTEDAIAFGKKFA